MADISTSVAAGVQAYAAAEAALLTAHDALLKLPAVYADIAAARPAVTGDVKPFSFFEGQQYGSYARQLAASVNSVYSEVIERHQADTERAKELGIDLPPPPAPAGTVHPDGGGR
jgi:hypothetical protein